MALPSVRALPIRVRLALAYALFLILTFAVAGTFVLISLENGMERQVDLSLRARAARVQNQLTLGPDGRVSGANANRVLAAMGQEEDLNAPVIWVQVLDARGISLASEPDLPPAQLPRLTT